MFGLGLTKIIPYVIYAGLIVLVGVGLFRPKIALFATITLLPFRILLVQLHQFPLGKDVVDLLFMSVIAGIFLNSSRIKDYAGSGSSLLVRLMKFKIVFVFLSLFIGAAYFGLGNPIDLADVRFLNLKNYLMLPILFLMTHRLVENKRDVWILMVLMVVALFVADGKYAVDNRYRAFLTFSWEYKAEGIFEMLGGNVLASWKAHFIFLPMALFLVERRTILRVFYLGTTLFTLYPLLFLFSRGAYVAFYAGIVHLGLKKSKLLLLCAILIPIFWVTLLPVAVVERIQMTQDDYGEIDASAEQRFDLWMLCLRTFAKSPIFGVGFDTFHLMHSVRDDPHNMYFEVLAEQGIIGIGLVLGMFVITALNGRWLWKNASDDSLRGLGLAAPTVVLSCAITNFFGDRWTYIEISAFFFVLMAMVSKARIIATAEAAVAQASGDASPADAQEIVAARA